MGSVSVKPSTVLPVRDQSRIFTYVLAITWSVAVALPILASLISGKPAMGLPLLGVVFWYLLVRGARWLSPVAQADSSMRHGRYEGALQLCDRALAVEGEGAWVGTRRLVWLNRRTTTLISLGREDEALSAALDAMEVSADPETLGNCAMALLRLNRYDEAAALGRLALSLTRGRSVLCQGVLAMALLAEQKPAEAEATAASGLEDSRALYPFARLERYTICLAATARAVREQIRHSPPEGQPVYSRRTHRHGQPEIVSGPEILKVQRNREIAYLKDLSRTARGAPLLRSMALLEEADSLSDQADQIERVYALLKAAQNLAPEYCLWFAAQPGTFSRLTEDPYLTSLRAEAEARFAAWNAQAPDAEVIKEVLSSAETGAQARPGAQSSYQALMAQLITLASTFALLLLWTWRFLILN
jgi:tetratricopeptide (TPR) repeat protein